MIHILGLIGLGFVVLSPEGFGLGMVGGVVLGLIFDKTGLI